MADQVSADRSKIHEYDWQPPPQEFIRKVVLADCKVFSNALSCLDRIREYTGDILDHSIGHIAIHDRGLETERFYILRVDCVPVDQDGFPVENCLKERVAKPLIG